MNGPILAAVFGAGVPLLAGLAVAEGDRFRLLARAGTLPAREPHLARRSRLMDARLLPAIWAALGWLVGVWLAGPAGAVLLAGGGAAVPIALRRGRRVRRQRLVEEQLIDAVAALTSALRAGRSLAQALELAGSDVGEPLGPTLTATADRVRLGEPLDAALHGWEEDLGSADARLVVGVLRLHRRTGGALASALEDLGHTLRARLSGARELRTFTAQARLSSAILGLLPLGFFLFLSVISRRDIESAYRTPAGASAIALGLVLQGLAFLWIRRLLRVEPT